MQHKVVIIFPRYDPDEGSHYPYWYRVFEEAGKELDLMVLFEMGNLLAASRLSSLKKRIIIQKIKTKPFNLIERLLLLLKLRLKGYNHFYIHYSIWSLLIAKVVTLLLGGKTYLWDCEYYEVLPVNKLQRVAIKWCDVLVTGHTKIGEQYRKVLALGNKPIKIVRNWVIDDLQSGKWKAESGKQDKITIQQYSVATANKKKTKNILFVHHLSPRKGSRLLPKIVEKVVSIKPEVHFTIVDNGPDFNYLNKYFKKKNLISAVTMTGLLNRLETEKMFTKADLFIMPSMAEGSPRVILEAQKYGVPYVASDVGCVAEITPQELSQYIIKKGDCSLFVDRMIKLLSLREQEVKQTKNLLQSYNQQFKLSHALNEFMLIFK